MLGPATPRHAAATLDTRGHLFEDQLDEAAPRVAPVLPERELVGDDEGAPISVSR